MAAVSPAPSDEQCRLRTLLPGGGGQYPCVNVVTARGDRRVVMILFSGGAYDSFPVLPLLERHLGWLEDDVLPTS